MNRKYSFKKNYEIEKLVKSRVSVGNKFFVIYYRKTNNPAQIALSVSKKNGNAVERNYQKRVIREIVRETISSLDGYQMLIVAKKNSNELTFNEKKENINRLFSKIRKESKWKRIK